MTLNFGPPAHDYDEPDTTLPCEQVTCVICGKYIGSNDEITCMSKSCDNELEFEYRFGK